MTSQTFTSFSKKKSLNSLVNLAKAEQNYILKVRRDLHQIPELSWQEEKTLNYIKNEIYQFLPHIPCDHHFEEKTGGIVLDINFNKNYERILFRADIDALPIQEETHLTFSSKHPGIMHACGHDCHAAMLLGFLSAFAKNPMLPFKFNIRLIWQRAEEVPLIKSGGQILMEEGVFNDVSHVYGLHIDSKNKAGTFYSRPGALMSNPSIVSFSVKCTGGHVMDPHKGSNAIDILTDIHVQLRGFILRCVGPSEPISFVPSISQAGVTSNIMPNYGEATYTIRNFLSQKDLFFLIQKLKEKLISIINTYPDASLHKFHFAECFPTVVNHPDSFNMVNHILLKNGLDTEYSKLLFSGEDFAYYLKKQKGSYWILGASQNHWDHHTSKFNPDESVLWKGAAFWLLLALHHH